MKKRKQILGIIFGLVFVCVIAAAVLFCTLKPNHKTSLSLANNSGEKESKPFCYSGYTKAKYGFYTKKSEYVKMSDGTKIAVDIYLPSKTKNSGAEKNGAESKRFPVVFQYTPYGRAFTIPKKQSLAEKIKMKIGVGTAENTIDRANSHNSVYGSSDTIVQTLLSYGYAYVCADVRGTGASFGVKIDFMPEIALDGKELVDWISEQNWSDGNVGMFGGSYLGYTQLVTAGKAPKALKAIFPEVVAMDGFSTEMRPGGVFCQQYSNVDYQTLYEMNYYLPEDFVFPTSPVVDEDGDGDLWDEIPIDLNKNGTFLDDYNYPENPADEPKYADGKKRRHIYYLATREHKNNVPYNTLGPLAKNIDTKVQLGKGEHSLTLQAYNASPSASVPDIMKSNVAIYNHGSWMDTFITSTVELFNTMKESNLSKMIIDPGYHETTSPYWKYCGEDEQKSIDVYATELVRFYDHYLKGVENGIDKEPPVYIYNMNGDGWRFENEFPLARQDETEYYFCENGMLKNLASESEKGADKYKADLTQDSSYKAEGYDYKVSRYVMASPDEVPDRTEKDKTCLTYTTGGFSSDTEITGFPVLTLFASCNSKDADFHVYLEDVDEKGKAVLVTEGILRAGFAKERDINTMILAGEKNVEVLPKLPWHGYEESQYDEKVFENGKIAKLHFELFPTSWVFKKGHRIRVSIALADTPTFEMNSEVNENTVVTIWRDEQHKSKIVLPVIPR